jgi:hypothetical protein
MAVRAKSEHVEPDPAQTDGLTEPAQNWLARRGAMSRKKDCDHTPSTDINGSSLHAAVRPGAGDCQSLDHPCRCMTHMALANEPVQFSAAGPVAHRIWIPWRDGATPLLMTRRAGAAVRAASPCARATRVSSTSKS